MTFFPSLSILLISSALMLVAQLVYALFGFGSGLIAVGTIALVIPRVQDVVVLLLLISLPAELYVVYSSRHVISWRGVALICVGLAAGVPLGSFVLSRGDPAAVLAALGGFLIVVGLAFLTLRARRVAWPRWAGVLAGLVAGTLGGMFGTAGPPLIIYYRLAGFDRAAFRGNLMTIFLLLTLVRLPTYGAMGLITTERLWSALAIAPAMIIGAVLGNVLHVQIAERTFQRLVAVALAAIGVLLLLR